MNEKISIVSYSLGVNSIDVARIISEDINYNCKIVSENKNRGTISYNDFIENHEKYNKYCLIFDSLNTIMSLVDMDFLEKIQKCIILYTYNVNIQYIKMFKNEQIFSANFTDFGTNILFDYQEIKMKKNQTIHYLEKIIENKHNLEKTCNIYPYINSQSPHDMLNNSPKFKLLLTYLMINKDDRHCINIKYNIAGLVKIIEHFGFDLVVVDNSMSHYEKNRRLNYFNENKDKPIVLITSSTISNLKNVKYLHMINNNSFCYLLDKIYKYSNYNRVDEKLTVVFYVSKLSNNKNSIESITYQEKTKKIIENLNFYNNSLSFLKPIKLNNFA